ncbi:MAG: baseplate J/gp47 family protein, partial [Abditibacteriota bacterium]|nr:baseplate J/gp47 family protein [Abditibacteriota bacterium]
MYEKLTYDDIKKRMMAVVSSLETTDTVFDKRDGSIVNVALSPFAVESKNMFIALDWLLQQMFADTADRDYLILHCKERGITAPRPATQAERWIYVTFTDDCTLETATERLTEATFNRGALNYTIKTVEETKDPETGAFRCHAFCDTYGVEGNVDYGPMTPVQSIAYYSSATLIEGPIVQAVDEETTDEMRKRYFRSFDVRFGGNVADYRDFVDDIDGVSG